MTRTREDLWPYQCAIIDKIKQCNHPDKNERLPGLAIALEPGAGKTATVLTALSEMLETGEINKVLVVAPLLVAQTTWPDEPDEWEHLKHLEYTLIRVEDDDAEVNDLADQAYRRALDILQRRKKSLVARAKRRGLKPRDAEAAVKDAWNKRQAATFTPAEKAKKRKPDATPGKLARSVRNRAFERAKYEKLSRLARSPAALHFINKEALVWLWDDFRKGADWPYDVMVADDLRESRSGRRRTRKGADSTSRKPSNVSRWGVLGKVRSKVKFTLQLTGTPTPKGLENLWGLIYPIDLGRRLGASKTEFKRRWFHENQYTYELTPRTGAHDEIMSRVQDVMFSLDPADMPERPPYLTNPIRVRLPEATLEAYRRFERSLVSEEFDVEAANKGVLHGKLLQFANGSMYQEDGNDIPIHDLKLEALRDLINRLAGDPLLVAYTYKFDVDRISKAFPKAVVLTPENAVGVKKRWNAGQISVLLAHRASAGHGLNLQKGGAHMCEYGLTTDSELYDQFRKRLYRPGQTRTVYNHVIIASGTIDDDVYPQYLEPKAEAQDRILSSVRLNHSDQTLAEELRCLLGWSLVA